MKVKVSRLDLLVYGSAMLAVLLAGGSMAWSIAAHRPGPTYAVGERFDEVPGVTLASSDSTLILWIDSRCGACTASMPFYKQLTARTHRTRVIVMGRQSVDQLSEYIANYGIQASQVVSVGDTTLKFLGTPTVVLVGPDARVSSVWFGRRRGPSEETEILKRVD